MSDQLQRLREAVSEAMKELRLAEERAKAAWAAYWEYMDDFHIGDIVQHPLLRSRGVWVIRGFEYLPSGEVQIYVQEMINGNQKRWRRIAKDGLLRVVQAENDAR